MNRKGNPLIKICPAASALMMKVWLTNASFMVKSGKKNVKA